MGGAIRRSQHKVALAVFILISTIILDIVLIATIQEQKREQARNNLEQIKYCYNNVKYSYHTKKAFGICTNKSKTSFTGDVYVLNAETLEFVHETSRDVPRDRPLYFTWESVGQEFKSWKTGEVALSYILLGKDSAPGSNIWYLFDEDKEWLEWKYLPDEASDGTRYIAVQGIQRDEVLARYSFYRYGGFVLSFCIAGMLLALDTRRRRDDDNRTTNRSAC